jgi:ATP-dependent DNA helicase RecG
MFSTTDGFRIADEDLRLRGPGEFFGTAQHGIPELKAADLLKDIKILESARELAGLLISRDPGLVQPENRALRVELANRYGNKNLVYF